MSTGMCCALQKHLGEPNMGTTTLLESPNAKETTLDCLFSRYNPNFGSYFLCCQVVETEILFAERFSHQSLDY